jgi:hypothetical protein
MASKTPNCTKPRHSFKPYGGLKENPGYFSIGGTALKVVERCSYCGCERSKVIGDRNACGNRNHGWRYTNE